MNNLNFVKVIAFGIIFFSCGFLGIAISNLVRVISLKKNGIETCGTIDSIYVASNTDWEGKMYVAKFTVNSDTFKVENTYSTSWGSRFIIGEQVPIIFLKNDPEIAIFNTIKDFYLPVINGFLTTILLLSFSCFLIYRSEQVANFIMKLKQSDL